MVLVLVCLSTLTPVPLSVSASQPASQPVSAPHHGHALWPFGSHETGCPPSSPPTGLSRGTSNSLLLEGS